MPGQAGGIKRGLILFALAIPTSTSWGLLFGGHFDLTHAVIRVVLTIVLAAGTLGPILMFALPSCAVGGGKHQGGGWVFSFGKVKRTTFGTTIRLWPWQHYESGKRVRRLTVKVQGYSATLRFVFNATAFTPLTQFNELVEEEFGKWKPEIRRLLARYTNANDVGRDQAVKEFCDGLRSPSFSLKGSRIMSDVDELFLGQQVLSDEIDLSPAYVA